MRQYLDIQSLVDSDYYKNNKRIKWHVDHLKYDIFTKDLHSWLMNIDLLAEEKEAFNISNVSIYTELASYLTHVIDFIQLTDKGVTPIYSNQNNIFLDKIWNKKTVKTTLLSELENSRYKLNYLHFFYSFIVRIFPKKYVKNLIISSSNLSNQYLKGIKGITLKVIPHYFFKPNTKSSIFSRTLTNKIKSLLVQNIEESYFKLNTDHIESIEFIIDSYIARAHNDIINYKDFVSGFSNNTTLISGTGYSYYNRLFSVILKKEGIKVIRFNHGGDRCFFKDSYFWDNGDLDYIDEYVTYGIKWKVWLEKIVKKSGKKITIKSIGSDHYTKIYNKFVNQKSKKNNKILYIPNSFLGEIRVFPFAKIVDPILFDWQKYLIEVLQKNGFDVIYKKHPKGFLNEINFLGGLSSFQSTKPMIEALEDADMVLCDTAGSAFIESLCAGKNIVLINHLQRPFDLSSKPDLKKAVKIIDAYWEANILKIDEKKLIDSFTNFDIKKVDITKVAKDYYLSRE